jgi:CRP-like cAMP-binding protein
VTVRVVEAGETLFREGDESTHVARVTAGRLEVLKKVGGREVALGEIGPGEFVGEMGVLEGRPRSATARALTRTRLEVHDAASFLDLVSREPSQALAMLHGLSERLRATNDRLAAVEAREEPGEGERHAALARRARDGARVRVFGASEATRRVVPADGLGIVDLPFRVGRPPRHRERAPGPPVHLLVPDEAPFRLSRLHFSLVADDEGVAVRDEGSHLGTIVNGSLIGQHAARSVARLAPGEHTVVAGGRDSPYAFRVAVDAGA